MIVKLHPPATDQPRVAVEIGGFEMSLDRNKPTQRYICDMLIAGIMYEAESTQAIRDALQEGDTFIDVGANCGWFSTVAASRGAKVIAFEPNPDNCTDLSRNCPNALVVEAAVTDHEGTVELYTNLDNDGGHALWDCGNHPHNELTRTAGVQKRHVNCTRLDNYAHHNPAVLKIDTEGAEWHVLNGAGQMLANPSLRLVVCERNEFGLLMMGHAPAEIEEIMTRHGFTWDKPTEGTVQNWIFKR